MRNPSPPRLSARGFPRRRAAGGYTLIEAAIATVLIGVGFTAMLSLLGTGTIANKDGAELTAAVNLAGNIHEAAIRRPYAELFELEGTYNAADAKLETITGMDGWTQVVDVGYVDENRLTSTVAQYEPTARVTVTVRRNGRFVYRTSWIAAASD